MGSCNNPFERREFNPRSERGQNPHYTTFDSKQNSLSSRASNGSFASWIELSTFKSADFSAPKRPSVVVVLVRSCSFQCEKKLQSTVTAVHCNVRPVEATSLPSCTTNPHKLNAGEVLVQFMHSIKHDWCTHPSNPIPSNHLHLIH